MLPFLAGLLGFGADLVVPGATIAAEAAPEIAAGAAAAGEAAGAAGAAGAGAAAMSAGETAAGAESLKGIAKLLGPDWKQQMALWGLVMPAGGMALEHFVHGSPEDQMRKSLAIQAEFQRAEEARHGGGGGADYASMMGGGGSPRSLNELAADDAMTRDLADAAYKLRRARQARPRHLDQLEELLAGQQARIAALQSPRTLSPLEIMSMHDMMGSDLNAY